MQTNTQKNQPVKIVGLAQALINAQANALEHANALEKEIQEKGLDAVLDRLLTERRIRGF
jgi:uncharacterized membrane protein affecting hemolysin expression